MKRFLSTVIIAGFALSAIGTAAAQDRNARQINADRAKAMIEAAGYTNVRNVHQEKDHFDAEATNKNGKQVNVDVDPKTGAITEEPQGKEKDEHQN